MVAESPVTEETSALTSFRLVFGPFWRTILQPESQPENLRVKGWPSWGWNKLLRNTGWARAAAATAERAATEYFILKTWCYLAVGFVGLGALAEGEREREA